MSILKDTKLSSAVSAFAEEMRLRFAAKEQEGKHGWDSKSQIANEHIIAQMKFDVDDPTGVKLIDIANRAMILWYRENYS